MSAKSNFKAAVKKAKALYKTGRYKKWSDALKAGFNSAARIPAKRKPAKKKRSKRISGRSGNDSSRGAGHSSTSTKANTARNRTATTTKTITANVRIGAVSKRSRIKASLGKACLDYELAKTIKATKEAQKRKVRYRKLLKSL